MPARHTATTMRLWLVRKESPATGREGGARWTPAGSPPRGNNLLEENRSNASDSPMRHLFPQEHKPRKSTAPVKRGASRYHAGLRAQDHEGLSTQRSQPSPAPHI